MWVWFILEKASQNLRVKEQIWWKSVSISDFKCFKPWWLPLTLHPKNPPELRSSTSQLGFWWGQVWRTAPWTRAWVAPGDVSNSNFFDLKKMWWLWKNICGWNPTLTSCYPHPQKRKVDYGLKGGALKVQLLEIRLELAWNILKENLQKNTWWIALGRIRAGSHELTTRKAAGCGCAGCGCVAAVAAVVAAAAADVLQTALVRQSRKRPLTVWIHLRSCFRDVHLTCNGDVSRTCCFLFFNPVLCTDPFAWCMTNIIYWDNIPWRSFSYLPSSFFCSNFWD